MTTNNKGVGPLRFAEKLETAMRRQRMTQDELARRLRTAKSTVHYWLNGERFPSAGFWEPLARALGVSVDALVRDDVDLSDDEIDVRLSLPEAEFVQLVREIGLREARRRLLQRRDGGGDGGSSS